MTTTTASTTTMSKRTRELIQHIENKIADHERKRAVLVRQRDELRNESARAQATARLRQSEQRTSTISDPTPSTWGRVFTRLASTEQATA